MPWIHVVAATLLVIGTAALFLFLRAVETFSDGETEPRAVSHGAGASAGSSRTVHVFRWPPPAAGSAIPRAPRLDSVDADGADDLRWRRAA